MTELACIDCSTPIRRRGSRGPKPKYCLSCRKRRKMESSHRSVAKRKARDPEFARRIREEANERQRRYRAEDPEKYRQWDREWKREKWANDPEWRERQIRNRIANRYGIKLAEYDAMLERCGGLCEVCGGPPEEGKRLHIDHDHTCCPEKNRSCGECVRGLLCSTCNLGLGCFYDDADRMRAALAYLES